MTLVSGLVTSYLTAPSPLPAGVRQQFASAVYHASDFYSRGGTGTPPLPRDVMRRIYKAQRDSSPPQAALVSDYLALTGP